LSSTFTVQILGSQSVDANVFFFSTKTTAIITARITAIILTIDQVATPRAGITLGLPLPSDDHPVLKE
jgi:hypothetical protein